MTPPPFCSLGVLTGDLVPATVLVTMGPESYTAGVGSLRPVRHLAILLCLFFLSGAGGLVLQVVWMYRLGLVFGNAAYATAATLSSFFLGMAVGGRFWGDRVARVKRPLLAYGVLEWGVVVATLFWIWAASFYDARYPDFVELAHRIGGGLVGMKFVLSATLLFLPTFLMGGTFPVLAQHVAGERHRLGTMGALLYAVNTLGAGLGAFLGGFVFLRMFGVTRTLAGTLVLLTGVGAAAVWMGRLAPPLDVTDAPGLREKPRNVEAGKEMASNQPLLDRDAVLVALVSGVVTLGAQVLWTRMFAQVLQNSVYSFAAILVIFLLALGIGGVVAHILARGKRDPLTTVGLLLGASAALIALSPLIFYRLTDGLVYVGIGARWGTYIASVFFLVAAVLLVPVVVMGTVFPYLLKASRFKSLSSGSLAGRLVFFNSLGAALGPVLTGFILLDRLGLWASVVVLGVVYAVLGLFVTRSSRRRVRVMVLGLSVVVLATALFRPPPARLQPGEILKEVRQASDGVVAVVDNRGSLELRMDNYYVLGDSRSALVERMQAHIPMMLHDDGRSVLFLGMGTGITAGGALAHEPEQVVVVELVSNVIRLAERYFAPWTAGLFRDRRVRIVSDDARSFLLGSHDRFDVIVGDLFTPWHAGTGSLYTLEHFRLVREHLTDGGIFAQWLPLYQLTPEVFGSIAATFAEVFPQVTVWRADFSDTRASIALIGQDEGSVLDPVTIARGARIILGSTSDGRGVESDSGNGGDHMATLFYAGNLSRVPELIEGAVINTDDRRVVEFELPVRSQEANATGSGFMSGARLVRFLRTLHEAQPPDRDPYLARLPERERRYVHAGYLYFRYLRLARAGEFERADEILAKIEAITPEFAATIKAARAERTPE